MVAVASPAVEASEPTVDTGEPPVVGMVVPLSGEKAAVGEQLVESARWAAADTDVRIEAVDQGTSGGDTVRAIAELAGRDEVVAAIGPLDRQYGPAAARAARQAGLPLIVYSPVEGVELEGTEIFRARPAPGEQSRRLARYLVEQIGADSVGVMGPRSAFGDAMVPALIEALNDRGGRVTGLARYPEDTTDFRPVLEVLTGARVDIGTDRRPEGYSVGPEGTMSVRRTSSVDFEALVIADFHHVVARILPFLPGAGIATAADPDGTSVQLTGPIGWRGDGLEMAEDHARGAVFFDTFGGAADGGRARRFAVDFRNRFDRRATTPEAEVYDLVGMIAEFARPETDSGMRQSVVDRLRTADGYEGVTGRWRFDAAGAPRRTLRPYQVTGGGDWVRVSSGDR